MITDDDVVRLFERADPGAIRKRPRPWSMPPATSTPYERGAIDMTITRPAPTPTEPSESSLAGPLSPSPQPRSWRSSSARCVFAAKGGDVEPDSATSPSVVAPDPQVTATAVETATAFLDAVAAHDVDRAASLLSDSALAELGGLTNLGLQFEWDRATGFQMLVTSCEPSTASPAGVVTVTCAYDFEGIRSDEVGLGPFVGSTYMFRVQDGEIISLSDNIEVEANSFSPEVWEPFAAWVLENHPDDVTVMYNDSSQTDRRFTDESIRLWEQNSHEYVDTVTSAAGDLALGYEEAIASHDADRAASYLSDNALVKLGGLDRLRLLVAWDRATGFESIVSACEPVGSSSSGIEVRCPYDFQGMRSDELGLGPFGGSTDTFRIQNDKIVRGVSRHRDGRERVLGRGLGAVRGLVGRDSSRRCRGHVQRLLADRFPPHGRVDRTVGAADPGVRRPARGNAHHRTVTRPALPCAHA